MASATSGLGKPDWIGRGSVVTWIATILACAYIVWTGAWLYHSTMAFRDLFASLNVELPAPTQFVISTYRWSMPISFGSVIVLVVAKQFLVREKWVSLVITLAAVFAMEFTSSVIVRVLYQPLFILIEKLSK